MLEVIIEYLSYDFYNEIDIETMVNDLKYENLKIKKAMENPNCNSCQII